MENDVIFWNKLKAVRSEIDAVRLVLQRILPEAFTPIKPNGISFDDAYELSRRIRECESDIERLQNVIEAINKIDAVPDVLSTIQQAWTSTQFAGPVDAAHWIAFHLQRKYNITPKAEPRLVPCKEGN